MTSDETNLSTWWVLNDPSDPRHGTFNAYSNHGCRCAKCKAANAEQVAADRKRRAEEPVPDHVHGTENGYRNYGCRCEPCKAANTNASNRRHKARRERLKAERQSETGKVENQ